MLRTAHLVLVLHVGPGRGVRGEAGVAVAQLAQVGRGDGEAQVGVAAPALTSHHARGGGGAALHPALRHTQLRGRGRGRHQRRLVEQGAVCRYCTVLSLGAAYCLFGLLCLILLV